MKVTFKKNNNILYGQDFSYYKGIPYGVTFEAISYGAVFEDQEKTLWKLVAEGYGKLGKYHDYGNGALWVRC